MEFPNLVYRCPGPHFGPSGTTYVAEQVLDESDLAAALSAGWFATLPEAVEAFLAPPPSEPEAAPVPDDDAPPTRAELEAKAAELGLKVDGRWSDKRLLAEVTKALEG